MIRTTHFCLLAACIFFLAACGSNSQYGGLSQVQADSLKMAECDSLFKVMQQNRAMVFNSYKAYPLNFEACLISLDTMMNPFMKDWLLCLPESRLNASVRNGLGRYLVQEWGLRGDGKLPQRLYQRGILHHDDMASIILQSYQRKLKGEEIRLEEQILYYQDFWRAAGKPVDSALKYIDQKYLEE